IDWVIDELEASDGRERLADLYVSARSVRDAVLALADDLDAASRSALDTSELAGRIPNRTSRSMTTGLLGQIHLMRGEYAEAKRCADESLEIAEAISNLGTLPAAAAVALLAGLALGETVAAERYLAAIDEGLTASSSPQLNVRFIGDALLSVGGVDRARRYAERLRAHPVGRQLREVLVATAPGQIAASRSEADGVERRHLRAHGRARAR